MGIVSVDVGKTKIAKKTRSQLGQVKGEPTGFIRNHNRKTPIPERFWSKVNKTDGCWEWVGTLDPSGYGRILMDGKYLAAHRLMGMANGAIPKGKGYHGNCVCHKCDNRKCKPRSFILGTHRDNIKDMYDKNRHIRVSLIGESNAGAKLTNANVLEIRALLGKIPQSAAAKRYGVTQSSISRIAMKKTWSTISTKPL